MKNSIRVILVALLAVGLWSCADQQPENALPRDVQFTVRTSDVSSKSGRSANLPPGTELLLSIQNSIGDAVLTNERIELLLIGDAYVSKAFKLAPGTYSVTDFGLVNGSEVIYATPHAGSPLAGRVAKPLPYSFTVSTDELLTLDAEVLATDGASPEAFGYVNFDISGIDGRLIPITVFMVDQTGQHLADDVEATILETVPFPFQPDTLRHFFLEVGTNEIPFDLDPRRRYNLVVARHGFKKYVRNFTFSELENEFSGGSLDITLTPAFTYVAIGGYTRADIVPHRSGVGQITTDFNDFIGNTSWPVGAGTSNYFEGQLRGTGAHFITVEGDLDFLAELYLFPNISEIDASALTKLEFLPLLGNTMLREIDLSQNHALGNLDLNDCTSLSKATLSRIAPIRVVRISNTAFTTESVSAFIDDIYAAAIHNDIHDGQIYCENAAEPTQDAKNKIQELKQRGWFTEPSTYGN
jgi:hypothetical protein